MFELPPLRLTRLTGRERLQLEGEELPFSVNDFWQWSMSDLVSYARIEIRYW